MTSSLGHEQVIDVIGNKVSYLTNKGVITMYELHLDGSIIEFLFNNQQEYVA